VAGPASMLVALNRRYVHRLRGADRPGVSTRLPRYRNFAEGTGRGDARAADGSGFRREVSAARSACSPRHHGRHRNALIQRKARASG